MKNRLVSLGIIALLMVCALGAQASEKTSVVGTVVVEKGETIGDATAVRGDVKVYGHVTGDATAVMGNVHVYPGGVVDGDATAAMGRVTKDPGATIHGSVTSGGGHHHGRAAEKVGGNVVVGRGQTVSHASAVGGNVTVYGHVTGDADAIGGNIYVKPGGRIDGSAHVVGGRVIKEPGGTVGGDISSIDVPFPRWFLGSATRGMGGLVFWIFWAGVLIFHILLSVAIVALFPARMQVVSTAIVTRPGWSLLYGFVGALVILPLAVLLALTCVGIPFIPVELALAWVMWIVGAIGLKLALGLKIGEGIGRPFHSLIWAVILGTVILRLLRLIPFFVGSSIVMFLVLFGFGAVIMTGFGASMDWFARRFDRAQVTPPPQAPAAPTTTEDAGDSAQL